jgi:hypothetical protein
MDHLVTGIYTLKCVGKLTASVEALKEQIQNSQTKLEEAYRK